MSAALTQLIVDHVSQALFNADRLAFAIHLTHSLVPHLFQPIEWDVFLGNAVGKPSFSYAMQHVLPRAVPACASRYPNNMLALLHLHSLLLEQRKLLFQLLCKLLCMTLH